MNGTFTFKGSANGGVALAAAKFWGAVAKGTIVLPDESTKTLSKEDTAPMATSEPCTEEQLSFF